MRVAGLRFDHAQIPAEAQALRGEVRAFLAEEAASGGFVPTCDGFVRGFSIPFTRTLAERGWLGMTWPQRYGGGGRSAFERYVVVEELLAAGAPVAAHWITDRQCGPSLLRLGSEEQKQRLLPAMARGECFFAIGLSEPDAGSDLASVRTRAERVDGGWRLHGTKVWTSLAHHCEYIVVLCRTSPKGEQRHEGLSQLIAGLSDDGVEIRPIVDMTGRHHFNEVVLDGVFVADDMVLGEVGAGWAQITGELAWERCGPERYLATMPLLVALAGALGPDADDAAAASLGAILGEVVALRCMAVSVAARLQAGENPAAEAALVKELGSRCERGVTDVVRALYPGGADAGSSDRVTALLATAVLQAPGRTLGGGTNEILRGVVARALGGR